MIYMFYRLLYWLVVRKMDYDFPEIGNFIIPTDELIYVRGVGRPPTRKNIQKT